MNYQEPKKTLDFEPKCKTLAVPEAVTRLGKTVDQLADIVGALRDRLQPVMSPEPKVNGECVGMDQTYVPLADRIQSETDRLDRLFENLGDLLHRLEV